MSEPESLWRLPRILNKWLVNSIVPDDYSKPMTTAIYGYFSLFTPNDYTLPKPVPGGGRPYASLLVYGDSIVLLNDTKDVAIKQDVQLGFLGLSLGGSIQREIHRWVDAKIPKGWSSQISAGGEPTFLYSLRKESLWCGGGSGGFCGSNIDFTTTVQGSVGYYNSLGFTARGRIGRIKTSLEAHRSTIAGNILAPLHEGLRLLKTMDNTGADSAGTLSAWSDFEAYVFLSVAANLVAYSTLLQGQLRRNAYEISSSDVERFVPQATLGMAFSVGWLQVSVAHTYRGREIAGGRAHGWSSLAVGYTY